MEVVNANKVKNHNNKAKVVDVNINNNNKIIFFSHTRTIHEIKPTFY